MHHIWYILDVDWKIQTYETRSGEKVVDEFILKLQPKTKAKIAHSVKLLKQYGNNLGMPHSKALGSGLFELRIRGREEVRVFYCFVQDRTIYLLHGIKKQTQRTPKTELDIALERMNSLKSQ